MKAELTIPEEIIDQIADKVLEKMLPVMKDWCQPDCYLNVDELSTMLGKSKGQIYQWVDKAKHGLSDFPYQHAGRSLRFSKKEVENWLKKARKG